jgi:hypothetical protein
MGLLDTLLGRTKPVRANLDALFALPSAAVTLESAEGVVSSGMAGVCWKPPAGRSPADVQAEIAELLSLSDREEAAAGEAKLDAESGAITGAEPIAGAAVEPAAAPPAGDLQQTEDSFGYRWLLLEDKSIEELVTRVHLVNSTLSDAGWGPQLLCSAFAMVPGPHADSDAKPFNLVYLYKRGTFYPFAPTGKEQRDSELELHIRSVLGADLPVEADLSRWFPLWDLPVH